jgi:hypothetical protein
MKTREFGCIILHSSRSRFQNPRATFSELKSSKRLLKGGGKAGGFLFETRADLDAFRMVSAYTCKRCSWTGDNPYVHLPLFSMMTGPKGQPRTSTCLCGAGWLGTHAQL